MRMIVLFILLILSIGVQAQELFVVTEPASNAPAGSIGLRIGQSMFKEKLKEGYNYHLLPEITWGINKNLMVRSAVFMSNRNNKLVAEGGTLYAKYRFFSADDVHSHFRMAAFGRYSMNKADIHQEEIETVGHNTGYEGGLVATQLIQKVAISSSVSFEKAYNNNPDYVFPASQSSSATNYTLSIGRLMHPKKYVSFKETNINLMLEFLGQVLNENGKSYLDIVPSIQFIINSQARLDFAYRRQLYSSMLRSAPDGFYLNFQFNFFNVTKW
jgi:hypothetical protein